MAVQTGEWHQHEKWQVPRAPEQTGVHRFEQQDPANRLHTAARWPSWMGDAVKHRRHTIPPERADELMDLTLPDQEGRSVRLGSLWRDSKAVLVWLRQFGCPFCRAYARDLNRARRRFDDAGTSLVLIGQGTPVDAATFRRRLRIDLPVLADRERLSYLAAGTKLATLGELIGPAVVTKAIVAMARQRVILGSNTADEAQLGGAIIVTKNGEIAWAHLSEDASDMASADQILDVVERSPRS